jgi:hypothetical protein
VNAGQSGPSIEVDGSFDDALLGELTAAIEAVHPVIDSLAGTADAQLPTTRWLVSGDFATDVRRILGTPSGASFTTDRLGGEVAAKTLRSGQGRERVIALNGTLLLDEQDRRNLADHVFLAAHELTHVMQEEVRQLSGVMEGVPIPSETLRQGWRSVTRIVGDEYRADMVAGAVLKQVASVTDADGSTRPATIADTWALFHLGGLEAIVLDLHPVLPDLVQSYREWMIPLDALVQRLVTYTEQVATAVAHWQATCDHLDIADPWSLGDLPGAPAAELYVRPLWEPIYGQLRAQPLVPTVGELAEGEPELVADGERTVEAFWRSLGVTVSAVDGGDYVHVSEPTR